MTVKLHSRYAAARKILIFWCLFIGIGAVAGSVGMLSAPDGSALSMQGMLPYFQVLPFADVLFQNFVFSGIALLCVNGITNLTAAVLLFMKKKAGILSGGIFGVTLMAWITIQFVIFPPNLWSTSFFIFGFLQAATGFAAWVFYKQEHLGFDAAAYKNIGTDKSRLVVYFSRMGYTRRAAYEEANRSGACVYEVKSTEMTAGTLGFWWCGRFGMHRWDMPVEPVGVDLAEFAHVTVCSPIWVFNLSAPMRTFCKAERGKIREADYILVHFQKSAYANAVREMDALLGLTHTAAKSLCCRQGDIKKEYIL